MELKSLLDIVSRRKWTILLTTIVTLIAVVAYLYFIPPVYETSTTVRVASSSIATGDYNQFLYADRILNTYGEIASSLSVRDELIKRLSLKEIPDIKVRVLPETELIKITVTYSNPQTAATIATTLDNILIEQSQTFYSGGRLPEQEVIFQQIQQIEKELQQAQQIYAALTSEPSQDPQVVEAAKQLVDAKESSYMNLLNRYDQNRFEQAVSSNVVSVVDPPAIPIEPVRPQKVLSLLLGLPVGIIGGFGLALLKENLDSRLYTVQQIEHVTGLPSLAEIPKLKKKGKNKQPYYLNGNYVPHNAFRRLRIHLMNLEKTGAIKTLLVTSPVQGEGKSTVLINLAHTFAQSGKEVLIIDGNLRSPALHITMKCRNDQGLTSIIKDAAHPTKVAMSSSLPGIYVIPSGPQDQNPANLLDSQEMKSFIEEYRSRFDIVLIDSPAILSDIDASVIALYVDAVLLVVNSEKTRREELISACKNLRDVGANMVGIVLNRVKHL